MHPRLYRLIEKHQRIDRLLELEQRRAGRDPFRVMRLKKLKLRVKDLIHRFTFRSARRVRHAMP
ncbi:YdcH family protein [Sphingomonas sp. G124]|uniref:YdcH family protein n=1 Tax=Sphingomonas cremea TaxID=2904799 RepID=A0A9X1TZ67_9SPHN|nr:YdcH family protein [Sphingomonas cremea]MCF2515858.1 YdcH family protein [Sphingomonas cremea]